MLYKFNKGKFIEYLLYAGIIIEICGLELAAFRVISLEAGLLSCLPFFVTWVFSFGKFGES